MLSNLISVFTCFGAGIRYECQGLVPLLDAGE